MPYLVLILLVLVLRLVLVSRPGAPSPGVHVARPGELELGLVQLRQLSALAERRERHLVTQSGPGPGDRDGGQGGVDLLHLVVLERGLVTGEVDLV